MPAHTLVLSIALTAAAASTHAAVITNGSLTGPEGAGAVGSPWYLWNASPDTVDGVGPPNYTSMPWAPSPDGGTFVLTAGSTFPNSEGFAQMVSGFVVGETYQVDFYMTNLGFLDPATSDWIGEDGFYQLILDSAVLVGDSGILSKPAAEGDSIVWVEDSFTFTATATTHELAFLGRSVHPGGIEAIMGIDGIRISLVPAPGAIGVLGGLGLLGRRRR